MSLIQLQDLRLDFGDHPLFAGADFDLPAGQRIALVGRNGTGKSTLLKLIHGEIQPDGGRVVRRNDVRTALLAQEVPGGLSGTVFDVVADGLGEIGELLGRYHAVSLRLAEEPNLLGELEDLQHRLEAAGGWDSNNRVETAIHRLRLPQDAPFAELSGGMKRRVLMARALVGEPDVLLLDEPTNHLDIPAIEGLEELMMNFAGTLLFVTHDREFLKRLATMIVEVDRGRLTSWPGDWSEYQRRKEERLAEEQRHNELFDKKLAQEEAWIRQGIKARRTRNEGRVRALKKMREERAARRNLKGDARLRLQDSERTGKRVIEASGVNFAYEEDAPLIRDFSTLIARGDKIGVIGPNGSGKTTLLSLLLGNLEPESGTIRHGTNLEVAYFDQLRAALDDEATVADSVAGGSDKISVGGKTRHVISYLADFLFSAKEARGPVKALSGGERNRLLLARLFAQPFNVLVMDEPTNDLDVETLDLLEELLLDFSGTLLLVSHDRAFLDNVVTSSLVLEGGGKVGDYVGGYTDWLRQRAPEPQAAPKKEKKASPPKRPPKSERPRKLTFKERRELEELPAKIEALETEQTELHAKMGDPEFYRGSGDEIAAAKERMESVEEELLVVYERWEELEALAEAG